MRRVKAIAHDDEVSLVEHLDELRARVVVSIAVFGVALGLCFWQNQLLIELANAPLPAGHSQLLTLGVSEPFTTTMTVAAYGAFVLSLPIILYQVYAYVLPAFSHQQRRTVGPLLLLVPVLFLAGIAFGYFVVLPAAVRFFVNFNASEFNVLVQASQFYRFAATVLLAMGLVFQVPVAILAATRVGLVTVEQLRKSRRYAIVACAAIAAFLPGDAITLVLETVPLYVLYEASILVASLVVRRAAAREQGAGGSQGKPAPSPDDHPAEPSVQQIIDHVDPDHTD